jgi:hypothetical protein
MTKVCEGCGATYARRSGRSQAQWENQRYCSVTCQARANGGDHGRPPDHGARVVAGMHAAHPEWAGARRVKAERKAECKRQRMIRKLGKVLSRSRKKMRWVTHIGGPRCRCVACREERARQQRREWKHKMWHGVDTPETNNKYFRHRAQHLLYTRRQKALKRQRDRLNKNG